MGGTSVRLVRALVAAVAVLGAADRLQADLYTDIVGRVSEAADYNLVYGLAIPNSASYNSAGLIYTTNNSGSVTYPFDRVAYYLELDDGSGLQYAYVSMDAFTYDVSKIGVPYQASGAFFQQNVTNMNVVSNVGGVTNGTGIATGNIEFWPRNYSASVGSASPAGASGSTYDFGDSPSADGQYGSMQIHNYGAGQTIIAYNRWGGSGTSTSDLGIGNNTVFTTNNNQTNPDWTFRQNAGAYTVKNLAVLVHEADAVISLSDPTGRMVYQRNDQNEADVTVAGTYAGDVARIEARVVPVAGFTGVTTDWQTIADSPSGGTFSSTLTVPAGWYQLEVRSIGAGATQTSLATLDRFGVGEVFITAGQSNSANSGATRTSAADDRVSAFDYTTAGGVWQRAVDPQPIATATGGSPWPSMGDALVAELGVPVGFVSVGWGGTSVAQWLPGGTLYPRLEGAIDALADSGYRAILWHQGESDAGSGTTTANYIARLEQIIAQSRADAGWDVPWGVAIASYRPGVGGDPDITGAQWAVINSDPLVFLGAMTDDMIVPYRDQANYSGIHFNEAGLIEHGQRWAGAVYAFIVPEPSSTVLALSALGCAALLGLIRRRAAK